MHRRQLLATGALAGAVGLTGCLGGFGGASGGGTTTANADGAGTGATDDATLVVVDTLEAPGSTAGRQAVPVPDTPTVVDLFATWCAPCRPQMDNLVPVHREYADRVSFVSVTNERFGGGLTAEDVRAWWQDNDGAWTVGHDPNSELFRALEAGGLPFTAVFDADGQETYRHRGLASEAAIREQVRAVA
jgi:thiol-disulfide isomerase/thioredoxin